MDDKQNSGVIEEKLKAILDKIEERDAQSKLRFDHVDEQFRNLKESIGVTREAVKEKLVELNQLRKEVMIDREQYVRKDSNDIKIEAVVKAISANEKRITVIETRSIVWTSAIAMFFVIVQVIFRFIKS